MLFYEAQNLRLRYFSPGAAYISPTLVHRQYLSLQATTINMKPSFWAIREPCGIYYGVLFVNGSNQLLVFDYGRSGRGARSRHGIEAQSKKLNSQPAG